MAQANYVGGLSSLLNKTYRSVVDPVAAID